MVLIGLNTDKCLTEFALLPKSGIITTTLEELYK